MPEQKSQRSGAATVADITKPFETVMVPLGVKGLNLTDDPERLEPGEFQILTNAAHRSDYALTARNGLGDTLATVAGGVNAHSVGRANDPQNNTFTRLWGCDTGLYLGKSGVLSLVYAGLSGNPLCFQAMRTTRGVGSWMMVADSAKVRQVRVDGLAVTVGLSAPSVAATAALNTEDSVAVVLFGSGDSSAAANWAEVHGYDFSKPPFETYTPLANDGTSPDGAAVEFVAVPGPLVEAAGKGYYSFWSHGLTKDLSKLASNTTVSDDDFVHLLLKLSEPHLTQEVRVYFVCSATFDPLTLPGTSDTNNVDYYVHAFPHNDYSEYLQTQASLNAATQAAADQAAAQRAAHPGEATLQGIPISQIGTPQAGTTPAPTIPGAAPPQLQGGLQLPADKAWIEYGVVGRPLRRRDFQRGGETTGRDWSTVTGVIVYVQTTSTSSESITVFLSNLYIYGGSGIDSADPSLQSYDWRYTNYHTITGDESNPSPVMADANFKDTARTALTVTPAAYGDGNVVQRWYRRGGVLNTDWFYEGQGTTDGGTFVTALSDDEISEAGTLALDHYQAIPTVAADGTTVLAQPVHTIFGPYNGLLFALGDPYQPGNVNWCIPDQPGHWPATYYHQVCPASEELLAGLMYGGQPYVVSRRRPYVLYPSFGTDIVVSSAPTGAKRGIISRTGLCVTSHGIVGVAADGVWVIHGPGEETLISRKIETLFLGLPEHGYQAIDHTKETAIRVCEYDDELYLQFEDMAGHRQIYVYNWYGEYWRHQRWAMDEGAALVPDEGDAALLDVAVGGATPTLLVGHKTTGLFYGSTIGKYADGPNTISITAQTRDEDYGRPREEKDLGDIALELDRQAVDITLQNVLNGVTTNPAQVLSEGSGRVWAVFDAFGIIPQRAKTISTLITWQSSLTAQSRPFLYKIGLSFVPAPELTINRVTTWDDLGHPDEKYVTGITIDCDTGGVNRTVLVEADLSGVITTIATLTINHDGRHKNAYSWPGANAQLVRLRPMGDCVGWLLYRTDWIWEPEPPRVAKWDIYYENGWDQYYTGLDLYCHTYGATKTIEVYADQVLIGTYSVVTTARKVVHITLPWGRAHVLHFIATDNNAGTLFQHRWHTDPEPSEQTNWNQNFSPMGTLADKWFKAIVFECDTFGQNKSVTVELDGVVVTTLTVNTNGRRVQQVSFDQGTPSVPQQLGRILRIFPTDNFPSRLYSAVPVFDIEPYMFTRWETQEEDDGVPGYKVWLYANITLVSTTDVTMQIVIQRDQAGTGALQTQSYTILSTGGVKLDRYVPFTAAKGVKRKYVFTSSSAFRLYREESSVMMLPWGTSEQRTTRPFGNDDQDRPTRDMVVAALAAARPGGSGEMGVGA